MDQIIDSQDLKIKIPIKLKPVLHGLAITITYGECVENHPKMEKLGKISQQGFTLNDLINCQKWFQGSGTVCELHHLNEALIETGHEAKEAYLLIIRKGVDILLRESEKTTKDMMNEMRSFEWDTQAIMKTKLVNKHARHNVCFAEEPRGPDLKNGKGTIIAFNSVFCTNVIRDKLGSLLGHRAKHLLAEGNRYADVAVNGIGFHGDSERSKVIGVRIGQSFPLHYQWFIRFKPVGKTIKFMLNDGDIYVMSEKAVGKDWRCSSFLTLRHAAGASKYLVIKKEIK